MLFLKNNFSLIILRALVRALVTISKGGARTGVFIRARVRSFPRFTSAVKTVLIYGYDLVRQLRKTAQVLHPGGKMRILLTHPHALRAVLIGIIVIVIFTNLNAHTRAAEDLGRESLLYRVVTKDAHMIMVDASPAAVRSSLLRAGEIIRREDAPPEELLLNDYPYAVARGSGAILRPNPSDTLRGSRPRESIISYAVQPNDTVSGIAYRFTLSINTILWANNLRATSLIRPGDTLIIPPLDGVIHAVKRGETLSAIAQRYRVDAKKILMTNSLADASAVRVGAKLVIPEGRPPSAPIALRPTTAVRVAPSGPQGSRVAGSGLLWPTNGRSITQYFSWRHSGLDIDGTLASPVFASEDGVVETAQGGWNGGYGIVIVIDHGRGVKTRYGHLSRLRVKRGDRVERGQTIGIMGSTGRSSGSHLHFELLINSVRKNPLSYL